MLSCESRTLASVENWWRNPPAQRPVEPVPTGMGLDDASDADQVFEVGTLKIIAEPALALALDGASMDYVDDVMQQGFSIDAPNAALLGGGGSGGGGGGSACGCGH